MKRVSHKRGFTGIGLINPKLKVNVSACLRSAACFDTDIIYISGLRYTRQSADTMNVTSHIPTIQVDGNLFANFPDKSEIIGVEFIKSSIPLHQLNHPESAIYLFGPEDGDIPKDILEKCDKTVFIPSLYCLNLSMAVTVVLYDRFIRTIPQHVDRRAD